MTLKTTWKLWKSCALVDYVNGLMLHGTRSTNDFKIAIREFVKLLNKRWEKHGDRPNTPKLYSLILEICETKLDSKLRQKSIVRRAQSETKSIEGGISDIFSNEVITFKVSVPNAVIASTAVDYIYNNDFQVGTTVRLTKACTQYGFGYEL